MEKYTKMHPTARGNREMYEEWGWLIKHDRWAGHAGHFCLWDSKTFMPHTMSCQLTRKPGRYSGRKGSLPARTSNHSESPPRRPSSSFPNISPLRSNSKPTDILPQLGSDSPKSTKRLTEGAGDGCASNAKKRKKDNYRCVRFFLFQLEIVEYCEGEHTSQIWAIYL